VLEPQNAGPVSIFEHRSGCRQIVSETGADVVMYCGAPVDELFVVV